MIIQKFGGTSLGTPQRMQAVARLVNDGEVKVIVLSAVSGTTNHLVAIAQALYQKDHKEALRLIDEHEKKYHQFIKELFSTEEYQGKGAELIKAHFDFIRSFTKDLFTIYEERAVLAQGELISTALFHYYLSETGVPSVLLSALDFMRIDKEGEPDDWYIENNLGRLLKENEGPKLFVTQGYICRNAYGEIDNLKRGGSDYTASLVGAAMRADEIQIWTDIDGMHNNDPRVVDNTQPIRRLSFDEAAELAYFGAKILHPSSVLPAHKRDVPVRLKNTLDPEAEGTLISSSSGEKAIKAVAAKDNIVAIKIRSGRMLLAYGFLRKVFEVFERHKVPIDMITTSEVAVSLTIDDATRLKELVEELEEFGMVEVDEDQVIICIVGDFLGESTGYANQVMEALKSIPIRMISYGGSKNNISVLVSKENKAAALQALHGGLFS